MKTVDLSKINVKNEPKKLETEESVLAEGKSREEVLQILYQNLPSIKDVKSDSVLDASKYVKIARDYQYEHYRLLMYSDIVRLGLSNSFNFYYKRHLKQNGAVVAIFNTLNNKPVSVVFRSISEKEFVDFSLFYIVYGLDLLEKDFKYGDYLVVTEGLYDADSLRPIFKNVVATLTSNITTIQASVLKTVTNKFIIAFDNDEAGQNGFEKAIKVLGTDIKKLPMYGKDKDLGCIEEVKSNQLRYEKRVNYYKQELADCMSGEEGFLL